MPKIWVGRTTVNGEKKKRMAYDIFVTLSFLLFLRYLSFFFVAMKFLVTNMRFLGPLPKVFDMMQYFETILPSVDSL